MGKMRMRFISVLAVIITISQHSNCRKLGGEAHHHHHDDEHSEHHHTEDHHHDNSEDHHHNIHNHVDHQQEIQALESSIESVYASFDGSEDVDYSYNVIEDDSLEELDRSRAIPTTLEDGSVKNCVEKEAFREELKKDPELSCVHKTVEKCHYTYTTQFLPTKEEVCDETYEKRCTITYKQVAQNDSLLHCYNPLVRSCDQPETGSEECGEYFETGCTTRYVEKSPGKYVQDTACQRFPVTRCADTSCKMVPGPQECHEKVQVSLVEQPEEHCELEPFKSCRHKTTLIPRLKPESECTQVPQEICHIKYVNVRTEKIPYKTLWCYDEEIVTEISVKDTSVTTESPGYQYPEPEVPFTTPPRTTTTLPEYQDTEEPTTIPPPTTTLPPTTTPPPPPPPPTTTSAPTPPPTQPPPPPAPAPAPAPTVQFAPGDLEAAIILAIRQSVEKSLSEAQALKEAMVTRETSLRQELMAAVAEAVRQAVVQSVQSQVENNQLQKSSDLEFAIRNAIRLAVESSVEQALQSTTSGSTIKMTEQMTSEMELIESQIQAAVIQAIRRSLQAALEGRQEADTASQSLQSLQAAIRQSVLQALKAQVSRAVDMAQVRRDLQLAIRAAVEAAVSRRLQQSPGSRGEQVAREVVGEVMSDFRTAVVDGIQVKPADPRAAERAQSLLRQLSVVIRRAVQTQLAQSSV